MEKKSALHILMVMYSLLMLGAVIVGSVDGNRIWGKELKSKLAFAQWSPNGRLLLFGTDQGELHLYDHSGIFVVNSGSVVYE